MTIIVPPIKCQGIKTKIIPVIKEFVKTPVEGTWIEPFCGSCVVALNIQPKRAILADTNKHIITLYHDIQNSTINPLVVRSFLEQEGEKLSRFGEEYYYEVRNRFNETGNSLDFLFLNRACFNGVMRFNKHGKFNVPFGHKSDRFRRAYITKIINQVKVFHKVVSNKQWQFEVLDFRETLSKATEHDFVYADPPYMGRHVDYYNCWKERDENDLTTTLKNLPCRFLLSTWHNNKYRYNSAIGQYWQRNGFFVRTCEHFYHVGSTEDLRNAMTEALISNYKLPERTERHVFIKRQVSLFED